MCHYFPLQQHALVTSSKRKELLFCSKCSSEISPALNNWTLHKSRVFSPHSHSIRAGVYYIPNCNTPKQMMKSTNIFMLPISIFICLFFLSKAIFVCRFTLHNCLLGGKKVTTHSFRCNVVRLYESMMEGNWMVQALITFNWQLLDKISEMNETFISLAEICGIC